MKNSIRLVSLIAILLFAGLLAAQPGRGHQGMERMARSLDLSEEQEAKMMDMKLKMKKEMLPLKTEMDKLRGEMKIELTADKFNEGKVSKLNEQISQLHKQMQMKRVLHQRAVRDMLTAEQQKKFDLHLLSPEKKRGQGSPGAPRSFREMKPQRHQ